MARGGLLPGGPGQLWSDDPNAIELDDGTTAVPSDIGIDPSTIDTGIDEHMEMLEQERAAQGAEDTANYAQLEEDTRTSIGEADTAARKQQARMDEDYQSQLSAIIKKRKAFLAQLSPYFS